MSFYVRASAFEIPPPSEKDFDIPEEQDVVFPPLKGKQKVINDTINQIFDETWNRIKESGDDVDLKAAQVEAFINSSDIQIDAFDLSSNKQWF